MSKLAEDICAEIKRMAEAADHFKNLWMQANDELERANQKLAQATSELEELKFRTEGLEKEK